MALGFYLRKLRVSGNQKKPAEVAFSKGLNVISGASNTGKSYIFQCVDYLLGARKQPKEIEESRGYSIFELEIGAMNNETFTLKRSLSENRFLIKKGEIDGDGQEEEYGERLSDDPKNISTFLLELCGFSNVELKKSKFEKARLSFRDVAGLTLVDEQQIITENSPVYNSNESIGRTKEQSLFYYLLTGKDAKDFKEVEDPKTFKAKINGKIEFLKDLIFKNQKRLDAYKGQNTDDLRRNIDQSLDALTLEYNDYIIKIDELKKKRNLYHIQRTTKESAILFKKELVERFELLEKHYLSDLERLQFISEGNHLITQLNNVNCPVCGSHLDEHHIDCLIKYQENNISFENASNSEIKKIALKLDELKESINVLKGEIAKETLLVFKLNDRVKNADIELAKNLSPVTSTLRERINTLFNEKKRLEEYDRLRDQITNYTHQIKELDDQLKLKNKQNNRSVSINKTALNKFCEIVEKTLNSWKYPDITSLTFDARNDPFDIVINSNNRGSSGKGIRAITYSAFIISLMEFCYDKQRPHSYNILIDSPLTTFKEKDKAEEAINKETEDSFFYELSAINQYFQIIILDNKEPPSSIISRINYVHFSGEKGIGRQGFFS